jgi:hypothetical protein
MNWIISLVWLAIIGVCLELLARREDRRKRAIDYHRRTQVYEAPYVFSYSNNDFRFIELYTPNPEKCADSQYRFDRHGFRLDAYNVQLSNTEPSNQVWFFGGSTAMGLCVKEDDTVSAHLNRLLASNHRTVRVVNMGIGGYSSTNELLLLIELMRAGHRPAGVIFYDGINEKPTPKYFRKWQKGSSLADQCRLMRSGIPRPLRQQAAELKYWLKTYVRAYDYVAELKRERLRRQAASDKLSFPGDWEPVVAQYVRNSIMLRGICDVYGVFSLFFFQPVLQYEVHYNIRRLSEYENINLVPNCRQNEFQRREVLYRSHMTELRRLLGADHVDLYDVFRGCDGERLYDDPRHPNGAGNRIVAGEIYRHLSLRLQRLEAAAACPSAARAGQFS